MATRRVAKSAIDWAAFAERVPKSQMDAFRAFKAKSDTFVSRVHRYPEKLPAINFAMYKSRLGSASLVDQFEKQYQNLTIAYPKDPDNLAAKIEADVKEADAKTKAYVAEVKKTMADASALLEAIDSVPPPNEMTLEMYTDYFPDLSRNPEERPTFWPHTQQAQPGQDPDEIK